MTAHAPRLVDSVTDQTFTARVLQAERPVLETKGTAGLRAGLMDALREAVRTGKLPPGTPAAVLPEPRCRSRHRPEHRRRRVCGAGGRGLAHRPAGIGHPGGAAGRAAAGRVDPGDGRGGGPGAAPYGAPATRT